MSLLLLLLTEAASIDSCKSRVKHKCQTINHYTWNRKCNCRNRLARFISVIRILGSVTEFSCINFLNPSPYAGSRPPSKDVRVSFVGEYITVFNGLSKLGFLTRSRAFISI